MFVSYSVIKVILQFCKENALLESMKAIQVRHFQLDIQKLEDNQYFKGLYFNAE